MDPEPDLSLPAAAEQNHLSSTNDVPTPIQRWRRLFAASKQHWGRICVLLKRSWSELIIAVANILVAFATLWMVSVTNSTLRVLERQLGALVTQERPYVIIDQARVIKKNGQYRVSVLIKNGGQTPAFGLTNLLEWRSAEGKSRYVEFPYPESDDAYSVDVGPGASQDLFDLGDHGPLSSADLQALEDRKSLFVWGVVKYRDAASSCLSLGFRLKSGEREKDEQGNDIWPLHFIPHGETTALEPPCFGKSYPKAKLPRPLD